MIEETYPAIIALEVIGRLKKNKKIIISNIISYNSVAGIKTRIKYSKL